MGFVVGCYMIVATEMKEGCVKGTRKDVPKFIPGNFWGHYRTAGP